MNTIFIPSAHPTRLHFFNKYYNVLNEDSDSRIIYILDDRHMSEDDQIAARRHTACHEIRSMSRVIETIVPRLNDPVRAREVLNVYGPACKLLIPLYAHYEMGIDKFALLDDDTFLLRPLDHYFGNSYVTYPDKLSRLSAKLLKVFVQAMGADVADFKQDVAYINSGQFIYTWEEDHLERTVNQFFSSDVILRTLMQAKDPHAAHAIRGLAWILEQYAYGIIFYRISKQHPITRWGTDVRVLTSTKQQYTIRKLPAYVHYLPADKKPFYESYPKLIDDFLRVK